MHNYLHQQLSDVHSVHVGIPMSIGCREFFGRAGLRPDTVGFQPPHVELITATEEIRAKT